MPPYRVGLIGCGRIGAQWHRADGMPHPATIAGAFDELEATQLVAGCNRGRERLEAFGRDFGVTALYTDYREMLAREELDILAIATPPPSHPELVEAAAAAGVRGIFCEKPMALSLGECDRMIAACHRHGVTMLVNCTRRWYGQFEAVRQLADAGRLGRLLHLVGHCQGCKPLPAWEAATEGPLLHDTVHLFDAMRFFAGDVQSIWGIAECRRRTQLRVEDTCYGVLRFASGADGCVIVDELTDYERFDLELQFEQGLIRLGFGEGLWTCRPLEFEQPWWNELVPDRLPEPSWSAPPLLCAARDLVESIEQERSPRCTSEDGRAAVEIIMALYESQLRGNAAVALPLDRPERMLDLLREQGVF